MKRIVVSLFVLGSAFASASTWTCYRYVDGKPTGGFVKVQASGEQEAVRKALAKYKDLGYRTDSVHCK